MGVIKIIGTPLYQWELGRKISISTSEHTIINKVEFSHDGDTESLVVKPRVENDQMVVDIPNIMLLSGRYIHVYISYSDENLLETVAYDILPVIKRPKPSDYVYTETEVLTWESLDERIKKLEKSTGGADISKEDIQDAVNEYLDNNPVSFKETDPTVPDWAKQPNPPKQPDALPNPHKLTFSGAVSAEYDGSEAVEVVIQQGGTDGGMKLLVDYTTETETLNAEIGSLVFTKDVNGEPFSVKNLLVKIVGKVINTTDNDASIRIAYTNADTRLWKEFYCKPINSYFSVDAQFSVDDSGIVSLKGPFSSSNIAMEATDSSRMIRITAFNAVGINSNNATKTHLAAGTTIRAWGW